MGASRTAEEIGRAFANVAVNVSSRDHMITEVDSEPQIVICTPGSEPWTSQGFSAAVLLDAHVALSRPDLRAEEETLRRWMEVASRVRPDGRVVVVAPPSLACVQALIRWDPIGHADLVLAERESMRMVPAAKTVELSGPLEAVQAFIDEVELARHAKVLGPVSTSAQQVRTYISVPRAEGASLVGKIKAVMAARSAKKAPLVTVRVDPSVIG